MSVAAKIFVFAIAITFSRNAAGQSPDVAAAREIARADCEFSDLSVQKGMPAACLQYFADDGIAFGPAAVNGKNYWGSRKNWNSTLMWQPIFAVVARAGDLGYTTGPWELRKAGGGPAVAFGHYVTLWRKDSSGQWKIALDVGTDNPQPTEPPPPLQVLPAEAAIASREYARKSFEKAWHDFSAAAGSEAGKAILSAAGDNVHIYRDNSAPAVGMAAAQVMLESERGKQTRSAGHTTLSKSGDLAYTYGSYSEERGNVTEHGIYLTIWRTNLNSDWQLVLDLTKKLPANKT